MAGNANVFASEATGNGVMSPDRGLVSTISESGRIGDRCRNVEESPRLEVARKTFPRLGCLDLSEIGLSPTQLNSDDFCDRFLWFVCH